MVPGWTGRYERRIGRGDRPHRSDRRTRRSGPVWAIGLIRTFVPARAIRRLGLTRVFVSAIGEWRRIGLRGVKKIGLLGVGTDRFLRLGRHCGVDQAIGSARVVESALSGGTDTRVGHDGLVGADFQIKSQIFGPMARRDEFWHGPTFLRLLRQWVNLLISASRMPVGVTAPLGAQQSHVSTCVLAEVGRLLVRRH